MLEMAEALSALYQARSRRRRAPSVRERGPSTRWMAARLRPHGSMGQSRLDTSWGVAVASRSSGRGSRLGL